MSDEMKAKLEEFLAPIQRDNTKTNETKASIADHVAKFAAFLETTAKANDQNAPAKSA